VDLSRSKSDQGRRTSAETVLPATAPLLPSMSTGLVRTFLDKDAIAVLGTECPITSVFADPFGEFVMSALFEGQDIGTALLRARSHFLSEFRNPLGLAYTLYGRGVTRLGARPQVPPRTTDAATVTAGSTRRKRP
jgi:hypothetical protein